MTSLTYIVTLWTKVYLIKCSGILDGAIIQAVLNGWSVDFSGTLFYYDFHVFLAIDYVPALRYMLKLYIFFFSKLVFWRACFRTDLEKSLLLDNLPVYRYTNCWRNYYNKLLHSIIVLCVDAPGKVLLYTTTIKNPRSSRI